MSQLPSTRNRIFSEETQFRAAVSESVAQKMGSQLNFVTNRQYDEKEYFLNGPYGQVITFPQLGLDGLYVFPFDAEIINVAMFNLVAGTSGTTELDVKRATSSGGAFSTIFSTTPKISSSAAANAFLLAYAITEDTTGQVWTPNGSPPTGCTPAVFSGGAPFQVSSGHAIRVDLISAMPNAQNTGLIIFHRPR